MKYEFTSDTRRALDRARKSAAKLRHDYVGTEHMLLALLAPPDPIMKWLLEQLEVSPATLREELLATVERGPGPEIRHAELPYTSRGKKVLEFAMAEARELSDRHVGAEHLFLGLLREKKGKAAWVLGTLGITAERARGRVLEMRDRRPEEELDPAEGGPQQVRRRGRGREDVPEIPVPRPDREGERAVWFLEIDADAVTPIYEQIIARIEEAVAMGRLEEEERLPPIRQLAEELGIAPGTVARAYSALEERGVLVTEGAKGTRVAPRPSSTAAADERAETLEGLLRPVVVAAYHLGATGEQLRKALDRAMKGIFGLLA